MKTQIVPNPKNSRATPCNPTANGKPPLLTSYSVDFTMRQYADLQEGCAQLDIVPEELIVRAVEKFLPAMEAATQPQTRLPNDLAASPSFLELESASAMAMAFMDLIVLRQSSDSLSEERSGVFGIGVANLHHHVEAKLLAASNAAIREIQTFKKLASGGSSNGGR